MLLIIIAICIFIFVVLLLLHMIYKAYKVRICYHDLSFSHLPDSFNGTKIFFISDIHRRKISRSFKDKIREYKVELVIIGGDLTEKGVPIERVSDNLEVLKELGPTYFVWGNNDYKSDVHSLDSLLLSKRIAVLDNKAIQLERESGEKIFLLGVDDLQEGHCNLNDALMDGGDENSFRILVSHNPRIKNELKPEHRIQLLLSGHTHGGQIRVFNYGYYKLGGIERLDNTVVLVSNGYGTRKLPLRLGTDAQCHVITLTTAN